MQQIYRRTPVPTCASNKVILQLYWNRTVAWVFSCKFAAYFQNTFSHIFRTPLIKNTSGGLQQQLQLSRAKVKMTNSDLRCQKPPWDVRSYLGSFIYYASKIFEKLTFLPADTHTNGSTWMETSNCFHENLTFRSL